MALHPLPGSRKIFDLQRIDPQFLMTRRNLRAQVCIIGSGIAGSLCAKYLAQSADSILIVERGAHVSHAERLKRRKHEKPISTALHHHVVAGEFRDKKIQYVYAVGGTTNHWIGQTPRLLPDDFQMNSRYGVMQDWPISYEELEPYYCLAEQEMSIAGNPDNPRVPRSNPYPLKAHELSPADLLFQRCFPAGSVVALPQARPTASVGNRPACCGSAVCGLCPIDSKYTTLNTHIPELLNSPSVKLLDSTAVLYLETDGRRRVTAVRGLSSDEEEIQIEADLFVLAANALENPAIILRSPGLKIHSFTGKCLFDHPNFTVALRLSQPGYPAYGQSLFTGHCYEFYDGDFRKHHSAALGEIYNPGHLSISHFVTEAGLAGFTGTQLRDQVTAQYQNQITMNFLLEDHPNPDNHIRIGKRNGALKIPETEIYYSRYSAYVEEARNHILKELPGYVSSLGVRQIIATDITDNAGHLLGTCRMGKYDQGAVDRSLRYHEADNLYVLGGSAFTTYSPSNPTLTIAALAIRLASELKRLL